MAKGTIKRLVREKNCGFIRPDDGGEDVYFGFSLLNGVNAQVGQQVEYDSERGAKGLRACSLKILGASPKIFATVNSVNCYRFLNPYNFIRTIQKGRENGRILGNCPPPPHDRYVGLTGRITCDVEAVTPLFISDSHAVKKDDNGHRTYRFFQYGGQPALPASSLRGMVRSVFEALTNSCYAVFQRDSLRKGNQEISYPLEYREARPSEMIPARVVHINEDEGAILEKLDCARFPVNIKAGLVRKAYPPRVKEDDQIFNASQSKLPLGAFDGMRVGALVLKDPVEHHKNRIHFYAFHVTAIEPVEEGKPVGLRGDENHELVYGWLHLTGPNIENKHDERLFFRWDDRRPESPRREEIPAKYICICNRLVVEEYNHHLSGYWERLKDAVQELNKAQKRWPHDNTIMPQPSTFVEEGRVLRKGDLVYVKLDENDKHLGILLRPVAIPRVRYRHCREDFLPEYLNKHCERYDALCPACRVFGWVHENAEKMSTEQLTAYAGRVRFSHGKIKGNPNIEKREIRLAILSTPKPTTTSFYLLDSEGKPNVGVTYDTDNARLRGRKMYRHHGKANPGEYESKVKNEQNRTIIGALKPETKFIFSIDFENLAPLELGALLYALELEDGMVHRLGFAKPLGFGSIKLKVTEVKTVNWATRLSSISKDVGWELMGNNQRAEFKLSFLEEMRKLYGTEFDDVLNDLQSLLRTPPSLPIHYPRPSKLLDQDNHPQYEWFVGNKKRRDGAEVLDLASDDKVGLPLIDEKGRDV